MTLQTAAGCEPNTVLRKRVRLSARRQTLNRLLRSRTLMIGLFMASALVVLSVGAPLFTGVDPTDMDMSMIMKPPSAQHPFGTDAFGRDLFSWVLYGGRISLLVGLSVAAVTTITGVVLGSLSGYYPRLDSIIMRAMDVLMAFPEILLALGIVAILGPRISNIIIALLITYTPRPARVLRGAFLSLKGEQFVEAARCVGVSDLRIILRHMLPNCVAPLMVQQTYILAIAILAEAGLSFLGVGVPPSFPSLGGALADARAVIRYAPWMSLYPGLYISLLVLGVNLLGDGLRDVLDPRLRL